MTASRTARAPVVLAGDFVFICFTSVSEAVLSRLAYISCVIDLGMADSSSSIEGPHQHGANRCDGVDMACETY